MTPAKLAFELGISDKTLRAWLRRTFPRPLGDKGSAWTMTPEEVAAARRMEWRPTGRTASTPASSQHYSSSSTKSSAPAGVSAASPPARSTDVAFAMLAKLIAGVLPVTATLTYSEKPGIYGVFYLGDDFPLTGAGVANGTLVYIGKTESSQLTQDLKQHLADGKTGHSTLRRTFAALLWNNLGLRPIPRSATEEADRRFKHYKLDNEGERKLTAWMRENLGLSFIACDCPIAEIRRLEDEMIRAAVPVLNLASNPTNPFLKRIKAARAECVALARREQASTSRDASE